MRWQLFLTLFILGISAFCSAAVKPRYGGTLKVEVDLLENIDREQLFDSAGDEFHSTYGIPFEAKESTLVVDLGGIEPTAQLEIEQSTAKLQEANNRCHWILDYPFFNHQHPTSVVFENGKLTLQTSEPDYLGIVAASECLMPEHFRILNPFRKTQFAYEANPDQYQGRPFIDSIIPVSVDAANPYLSFKLGDVDVIEVPENRFAQINQDPDLTLLNGPRFYIYLRTSNLTQPQAAALVSALNIPEMTKAVLNDHAEMLLPAPENPDASTLSGMTIQIKIPDDEPFHLLGERMMVQWNRAGITTTTKPGALESPAVELLALQMNTGDLDAFRYLLLREDKNRQSKDSAWFDDWDQLEADGKIIPLLLYTSRIAARKNIQNLAILPNGSPDFANCWILTP